MKQKIVSLCIIAFMAMTRGYGQLTTTVPDITVLQGDTSNVVIYFDFGEQAYTAYQLDVAYPDGITSAMNDDGCPVFIKGNVYSESHDISSIYTAKGLDRFQCFSLSSEPFAAQSGKLLELPIRVPKSMAEGKYQATISPIEFVQTDAMPARPESITFNITVAMPIHVEVAESDGGHIEGLSTGVYAHYADLQLTAVPDEDFMLKGWLINDKLINETALTLNLKADSDMTVKALFEREFYNHSMALVKGWNWVSSYISEAWPLELFDSNVNRVVGQSEELINDSQYGLVGGLEQLSAGMAYKVEASEDFAINFRGHLFNVPMTLKKGWNWIAYPWIESRSVSATIINAEEGDCITSQSGFAEYADGYWEGSVTTLIPGVGYLYKSVSDKTLGFDFSVSSDNESKVPFYAGCEPSDDLAVDIHAYPNTMNITARLYLEGKELTGDDYVIYAMNANELRGTGVYVGNNFYLTVYGDKPVDITFLVKDVSTGKTFWAEEILTFCNDVIGNRKQPYAINIGEANGIADIENGKLKIGDSVYDLFGRKINANSPLFNPQFRKGIYIVNGRKVVNGRYINK